MDIIDWSWPGDYDKDAILDSDDEDCFIPTSLEIEEQDED